METWDGLTEREATARVGKLLEATDDSARHASWHEVLALLGPHLETWIGNSFLLRRLRLESEDDARAVLVEVIGRLRRDDFANLRAFQSRTSRVTPSQEAPEDPLEVVARLGPVIVDEAEATAMPSAPDGAATPLRGWLLRLLRYATLDHARARYGQSQQGSARDVGTDAARLSEAPPLAERPPITDAMTARTVLEELNAYVATLPAPMPEALRLWMDDVPYDDIAEQLTLGPADAAKKLVRAAHARLRHRFRDRWAAVL